MMNNTITAKQVGLITKHAKNNGISESAIKETINEKYGKGIWELTKQEASEVISSLGYNPQRCSCGIC